MTTGLHCMVLPSPMGTNNGYVMIPPSHPNYRKEAECEKYDCHGGVTFTGKLTGQDGWWIGFDTLHLGDLVPGVDIGRTTTSVFREVEWVMDEVTRLAAQVGPGFPKNWMFIPV